MYNRCRDSSGRNRKCTALDSEKLLTTYVAKWIPDSAFCEDMFLYNLGELKLQIVGECNWGDHTDERYKDSRAKSRRSD